MIALIGNTGFIGKNLLPYLESENMDVFGISLRDPDWKDQLKKSDYFINLVGKAHDHESIAKEDQYYYANVKLVQDIFEVFLVSSAKVFIHISSIAAVEEFESNSVISESNICNPVSWYGKSKYEAEKWLMSQILPIDKKVIILRPPMVHGAGDKGNLGLLYKFISKGIPYPLASFKNKRSFISISNFCFFISEIIRKDEMLPSGIYNICDDEAVSVVEVIIVIKKVTGKETFNFAFPKFMIQFIAKIGDFVPIPLNTKRLKKLTGNLIVSNGKVKHVLNMKKLPKSAYEGLEETIRSFSKMEV